MPKNIKLLSVLIFTFILGTLLIWQGVQNLNHIGAESVNPPKILGETLINTEDSNSNEKAFVARVIDGDTIEVKIEGERYTVRYIGIDTPETKDPRKEVECFGKEAAEENKRLVEGKEIFLEKDVSDTDRYNRLLRYVYVKLSDGNTLFANDYLVRQGFAHAYSFPPDVKYSERFASAEIQAKENLRGLFSKCN